MASSLENETFSLPTAFFSSLIAALVSIIPHMVDRQAGYPPEGKCRLSCGSTLFQNVTHSPYRVYDLFVRVFVYLISQMVYVNVNDVRLRVEVLPPHVLRDERSRQDPERVPQEILQERVLLKRKFRFLVAPFGLPRDGVEAQVRELKRGRRLSAAPR